MAKKIFFLFFVFYCFLQLQGQEQKKSIAGKINSIVSSSNDGEKEITPEIVEETIRKRDSIVRTEDSLSLKDTLAYYDSILSLYAFGRTAEEIVSQIDTAQFKIRMQLSKNQTPSQNYQTEKEWQGEYSIINNNTFKQSLKLDSTKKIFGWHPFWMGNAYESYNFSLLSSIAYFSYELDPYTGKYKTIHNWETTALVDSAKAHNCEVLLTVTNFGKTFNEVFLKNPVAQNTFITTIISLLKLRDANGINIDFEGVDGSCQEDFTNFIIAVSSSLKTENSNYRVTVALPAVDFEKVYDIPNIKAYIDLFIIMGYEYYGSTSLTAGPISPLSSGNMWMPLDLETSVDQYLAQGLEPQKLLLGISYYGAEWETFDLKFPSKVKQFVKYHTYKNIKKITKNFSCIIDEVSFSKAYVYKDNENNYRQIWFEDSLTLAHKYDFVKSKGLGGVGIWALGYDNGRTELWKLLAAKFSVPEKKEDSKLNLKSFSFRRILNLILRYATNPQSIMSSPRPIMMLFGSVFGLALGSFFILLRYGFRIKKVFNIALKSTIAIAVIVGLALLFILFKYMAFKEMFYLLGGLLLGLLLFYLFSRRFISDKDLP